MTKSVALQMDEKPKWPGYAVTFRSKKATEPWMKFRQTRSHFKKFTHMRQNTN